MNPLLFGLQPSLQALGFGSGALGGFNPLLGQPEISRFSQPDAPVGTEITRLSQPDYPVQSTAAGFGGQGAANMATCPGCGHSFQFPAMKQL